MSRLHDEKIITDGVEDVIEAKDLVPYVIEGMLGEYLARSRCRGEAGEREFAKDGVENFGQLEAEMHGGNGKREKIAVYVCPLQYSWEDGLMTVSGIFKLPAIHYRFRFHPTTMVRKKKEEPSEEYFVGALLLDSSHRTPANIVPRGHSGSKGRRPVGLGGSTKT